MGSSSGTTMKAISKKSMKKPRAKITNMLTARKPVRPPGSCSSNSLISTSPPTPRNTRLKAVEPIRMAITIAVVRTVESLTCRRAARLKPPWAAARAMAPTAPSTPASVGVAMPKKMLPSTSRIRIRGAASTFTSPRAVSGGRPVVSSGGASSGRRALITTT